MTWQAGEQVLCQHSPTCPEASWSTAACPSASITGSTATTCTVSVTTWCAASFIASYFTADAAALPLPGLDPIIREFCDVDLAQGMGWVRHPYSNGFILKTILRSSTTPWFPLHRWELKEVRQRNRFLKVFWYQKDREKESVDFFKGN